MYIMEWSHRKKQCESIVLFIQKNLYKLTNDDEISGFLIFLIHYYLVGYTWFYIAVGPIDWVFFASVLFYIVLFITNEYFRGCILIKTERKLFNDRTWLGPWMGFNNIDISKVKTFYKRWIVINIALVIYRCTNVIRGSFLDVS